MVSSALKVERWMKSTGTFDPFKDNLPNGDETGSSRMKAGFWGTSGRYRRRREEDGFSVGVLNLPHEVLGGEWFDLDTHRLDDTASEHS